MYVHLSRRTFGYGLIICSGLMALIAYLALPFVDVGPLPLVGRLSFTGVQLLAPPIPTNSNLGDSTASTSPYLLVLVAVILLVLASIAALFLVFSDHAPKASPDVWFGRSVFALASIAAIVFLLIVAWPLSSSVSFLGSGFWLLVLAGLLVGIGGIVTML